MTAVETKILELVKDWVDLKPEKIIFPEDSFESLGFDSLDGIELIMDIEEEFKISISDDEMDNIHIVADLIKLIDKKLSEPMGNPTQQT